MSIKERLKEFISYLKIEVKSFEMSVGLSNGFVNNIGHSIREKSINKILNRYPDLSIDWLLTGQGGMLTSSNSPSLEAVPVNLHPQEIDDESGVAKYIFSPDGTMGMRVKIVPERAQAGYWLGHADPEYFDEFESEIIEVKQEHKGTYIGFEVRGDSMISTDPNIMEQNIYPGWRAIGRDLPKDKWAYKLHTHDYDKWIIVHRERGILIKQIINHDIVNGKITIHSLNPEYKDDVLELKEIDQIFNVVQVIPKHRK